VFSFSSSPAARIGFKLTVFHGNAQRAPPSRLTPVLTIDIESGINHLMKVIAVAG